MSYCIDANVFITVWHKLYPRAVFPTLYEEMERRLPGNIILIKPIFDEIEPVSGNPSREDFRKKYPLRLWMKNKLNVQETPIHTDIKHKGLELMNRYETDNNSKGAGDTDILLVAFSSLNNHTIVTLEADQKQAPSKKSNYKIPLICRRENIQCIDFVELLRRCNITV